MKYAFLVSKMVKSKKKVTPKVGEGVWNSDPGGGPYGIVVSTENDVESENYNRSSSARQRYLFFWI